MEKQLFKSEPPEKRRSLLQSSADKVEERSYYKSFSDGELTEIRKEFSDYSIKIAEKEAELKALQEEFKEAMSPWRKETKKAIELMRTKGEVVKETCFMFYDETMENVGYYNAYGVLVDQRKTEPGERQKTIQMQIKNGTNND
jgi:hypothetical protein